jgi:hypothetical protein
MKPLSTLSFNFNPSRYYEDGMGDYGDYEHGDYDHEDYHHG